MGFLISSFLAPFTTAFHIAKWLWERSCDWGWPMGLRIVAALAMAGTVLFLFLWALSGFQWPLFGD